MSYEEKIKVEVDKYLTFFIILFGHKHIIVPYMNPNSAKNEKGKKSDIVTQ